MTFHEYINATLPIPQSMPAWYLYGQGIEHFGKNDQPIIEDVPEITENELLVRVDAVGICASDAKMIRLGNTYPLFLGRDLASDPALLGHELALTIVNIGKNLQDEYRIGQRLSIQPDVFYQTIRKCIGVILPGGMTQYMIIGQETLDGDDGSYVFTTPDTLSYADVAVFEPWACVDAAYRPFRRLNLLEDGILWVCGNSDDVDLDIPIPSKQVIVSNISTKIRHQLQQMSVECIEANGLSPAEVNQQYADGKGIHDVILLSPSNTLIEQAQLILSKRGTLTIVSQRIYPDIAVDIGRIHYDFISIMGTDKPTLSSAYGAKNNRTELKKDGVLLIHGGGGSMGQMHIQRALTMPDGPHTIIVTNRGLERLESVKQQFLPLAQANNKQLITISPRENPEALEQTIQALTGGKGCDDIVMMFPSLEETQYLTTLLNTDGVLNLFAGMPHGNTIQMDITPIIQNRMQLIGTSGSSLDDQKRVLQKSLDEIIQPSQIVSAIGGLYAIKDAIHAIYERRYAGKIVIYPAFTDLPLIGLEDIKDTYPDVYAKLGHNHTWTKSAEEALFQQILG